MGYFQIYVADDFPLEEITSLGSEIERSKLFTAGYIAPNVGLTNPAGLIFAKEYEGIDTWILPDRNLVSRIAKIAKLGTVGADQTSRNALVVMSFCKAMDLNFEPSIAYHELAHALGNQDAIDELSWFRGGDNHDTQEWLDLTLGRIPRLSTVTAVTGASPGNLAFPLHRWKRNYAAVLKIATLELSALSPPEKSLALLDWMENKFVVAGPALMFAQRYFAPNSSKRGLLKGLRSADRTKAIQGAKNAAWDITHLSDFVKRVDEGVDQNIRYIFATADKLLGEIAPKLLIGNASGMQSEIQSEMRGLWGERDSIHISGKVVELLELARNHPTRRDRQLPVDEMISSLEREICLWGP